MTTTINASTSSGLVVTPDNSGNVVLQYNGVAGPAFMAYANTPQTFSSSTLTKINFGTEEYDTNSNFASSRFTPTVAGYYQLNAMLNFVDTSATLTESGIYFYKNAARYLDGNYAPNRGKLTHAAVIYFNGTTDYVEVYALAVGGGTCGVYGTATQSNGPSWFNGCLLRGA